MVLLWYHCKNPLLEPSFLRMISEINISLLISLLLKVTYYENLTFSVCKCYNRVPGASTNPRNVKKNNPVIFFFFGEPFSASL